MVLVQKHTLNLVSCLRMIILISSTVFRSMSSSILGMPSEHSLLLLSYAPMTLVILIYECVYVYVCFHRINVRTVWVPSMLPYNNIVIIVPRFWHLCMSRAQNLIWLPHTKQYKLDVYIYNISYIYYIYILYVL